MHRHIRLYNTLTRQIEDLDPIGSGEVSMYACGLTVYNYAHIGNLRTYVFEDILRRTLETAGYRVSHVMNITDVGHLTDDEDSGEDRITMTSRQSGRSVWEIARFYTDAFTADLEQINVLPPTVLCPATDHIADMIDLIKRLEDRGYTYLSGGNVYYDTSQFQGYGQLAALDLEGQTAGARIEIDPNKRHPRDFALWLTRSKYDHHVMLWDSPWGKGYPGWHIECSAMAMKYLGERVDIHCGGVDHIPVHHTNEIAQSEGAIGHRWVNIWMHGEWLLIKESKMGKSKGNFITLSHLIEEGFTPMDYRYYLLGAHYRKQLSFSREALMAAKTARHRLVDHVARLREETPMVATPAPPTDQEQIFWRAIDQDLGTPQGLAALWAVVRDRQLPPDARLAAVSRMDGVLGLDLVASEAQTLTAEIEDLIERRRMLRQEGRYAEADAIRDRLEEQGIILRDTADGVRWRRRDSQEGV